MCTLCLSKRSKCCNKKSTWISKLPSVWGEDFTCLQEDLPNLKVLERVLRMNNHFCCHSVQGPSSGQWFPGCLSSSKWPCLSRGAWNRWSPEVPSNLNHYVFFVILWFGYLDVLDLSVASRSETSSRHLLLLLAPAVPSQQSQWALWVPAPGFSLVTGSSAFGTLCPTWVQYMMGFGGEFKSRLAATPTVVQGWQEDSTHKWQLAQASLFISHSSACWKTLQLTRISRSFSQRHFSYSEALIPLIKHLWPEVMLGAASCSSKCFPADVPPILLWPCSHPLSICFLGTSEWLRARAWPHAALPSPSMESVFHLCQHWQRLNVRAACTGFHRNQFSHAALILEVLLSHLIVGQAQ